MKKSLFFTVMLTVAIGIAWSVWDYKTGKVPVSDTEATRLIPIRGDSPPGLRPFYMDKYEVTNGQYWRFDRNYQFPEGEEDFPATRITWYEAAAYAKWAGKRLPTVVEWQYASNARKRDFSPWDKIEPLPIEMNSGEFHLFRVGSFWRDRSPLGIVDMAGNAWEWTADTLRTADGTLMAIVKGGFSLRDGKLYFNGLHGADTVTVNTRSLVVGLRCVKDK